MGGGAMGSEVELALGRIGIWVAAEGPTMGLPAQEMSDLGRCAA